MKHIGIISVPVTDQQRSKEFYLRMGLSVVAETSFGNQHWVQLSFPEGGPDITLVTWFENMPAGCLRGNTISSNDIQEDIKKLSANGITAGKIDETPWGKFASVVDPDGNTWSLHQR